jgi:CRISPR-associated protein Csd1
MATQREERDMNWIQNLYETYENCANQIGYAPQEGQRPLLPVCHITAQAHIEIVIDGEGSFRSARLITEINDATTIIPSTEASASRSGKKPENHPLCDKLQYVAGDFNQHGGIVTVGFSKDKNEPYRNYINTLSDWCSSKFSHYKIKAVLTYVEKKTVIQDLITQRIFYIGSDGKFLPKKEVIRNIKVKDIFSVVDSQDNAFIRWKIESPDDRESRCWRDKSLWESWTHYYLNTRKEYSFCYVTGKNVINTNNHPKYIRREGDGAKLISSNDTFNFTFLGRFLTDNQACGIGLEVSHKFHYALSWLISRQGYQKGELAIVAWNTSGEMVPQPTDDPITLLYGNVPLEANQYAYTAQEIAISLKKKIAGYGTKLVKTDKVVVIAMDSSITKGKGRLAITYYRELTGSEFLERIDNWHLACAWLHNYREIKDKTTGKKKTISFIGAPAPADIAEAAYGSRIDDRLLEMTITRLLPCIVDEFPIPQDLIDLAVRRASNRVGIYNRDDKKNFNNDEYSWEKALSIACSLFKASNRRENYDMPLDETRNTRDYLYGRLLAIADVLEERALYKSGQKRATNAARYMQQFSQRPLSTWKQIHDSLTPYVLRLGGAYYYKNLIGEVKCLFNPDEYLLDQPLTGEYLLGYYCQRQKLEQKEKSESENAELETSSEQSTLDE